MNPAVVAQNDAVVEKANIKLDMARSVATRASTDLALLKSTLPAPSAASNVASATANLATTQANLTKSTAERIAATTQLSAAKTELVSVTTTATAATKETTARLLALRTKDDASAAAATRLSGSAVSAQEALDRAILKTVADGRALEIAK